MSSSARPMEAPEQVMGSHSSSSTGECPSYPSRSRSPPPPPPPPPPPLSIATTTTPTPTAVALFKRKRTKRLRASPTNFPSSSSTSSLEQQLPSATEVTTTTTTTEEEEEEDMAHCLILLAQGRPLQSPPPSGTTQTPPVVTPTEKFTSRKFTETVTTAGGKAGFYVYECKTCSKCFPSFQALGGHRASHKKPKMAVSVISMDFEDKKQGVGGDDHVDDHHQFQGGGAAAADMNMNMNMNMKTVVAASSPNNAKARVHECSICGAEFSSGQALGGHMRRHRPIIQAGHESQHVKKENSHVLASSSNNLQNMISHNNSNVLTLDLNLPAPSEELNSATTTEAFRSMVFSSALVDCHY